MKEYEEGITSEVVTITSKMSIEDLIKKIAEIKCNAVCKWIDSLKVDIENSVIFGTYLLGIELSKRLKKISDVTIIDIYPHLRNLINGHKFIVLNQNFNPTILKDADLVIDTTGLGGLKPELAKLIKAKIFLIEDPVSDGSDEVIINKSNILERLKAAKSTYKGILKTYGLNSKTSGTMTLLNEVLRKSLEEVLKEPGVLYGVSNLEFYEGLLFKEKEVKEYLHRIKRPALIVSTLKPVSYDNIINKYLNKINSHVENVSLFGF